MTDKNHRPPGLSDRAIRFDADVRPVRCAPFALACGGFSIGTAEFGAMSLLPCFFAALSPGPGAASHVVSAYAAGVAATTIAVLGARFPRRTLLIVLVTTYALRRLRRAGW